MSEIERRCKEKIMNNCNHRFCNSAWIYKRDAEGDITSGTRGLKCCKCNLIIKKSELNPNWRTINLNSWRSPGCQTGELNHNWKGGESRSTTYRRTQEAVERYKLDQYKCMKCGKTDTYPLNTHHKDENRLNNEKDNLEILCVACHSSGSPNASHRKERNSLGRFEAKVSK